MRTPGPRYPWRPTKEKRDMTLIVGFPIGKDGGGGTGTVVLGADGEEGGALHKSSVRKIEGVLGDDFCCLIGGAGSGDFIDLAVQEARIALKELQAPTNDDLRVTLEGIVTEIHRDRIDDLPEKEAADARFQLLCAVWTKADAKASLLKVGRGFSLVRTRPEAIGYGEYLASYLIETLSVNDLHRRQAERLTAYILAKVKAHVQYCGGPSQVVVLTAEGKAEAVPDLVVSEDETVTNLVMDAVRWLFHWTDIIGWNGNMAKIDETVDFVGKMIKDSIHRRYSDLARSLGGLIGPPTPQPPKDDSPTLPPSPG